MIQSSAKVVAGCAVCGLLAGVAMPHSASAKPIEQRSCHFAQYVPHAQNGLSKGDVDWRVLTTHKGRSGRVVVRGSGDHRADAKRFDSGAVEYAFRTDTSKETITIDGSEALWVIAFKDGRLLTYTGQCRAPRKN